MLATANVRPCRYTLPTHQRRGLVAAGSRRRWHPSSRPLTSRATTAQQQQLLQPDEGSGSSEGSGRGQRKLGRRSQTAEPQPQLQGWLQQEQGLSPQAADKHARRLAYIFGSQQAALDGLPTTFEWCRSRGLTGPQTAELLDRIGSQRHAGVLHFESTAQAAWQLIDSYIMAYIEPLRRAGAKLPKHTSLAEVLCSSSTAARALVMPRGHVEAWLAAVSQQAPAIAIGKLLCTAPLLVCSSPSTSRAVISWAANELGAPDPAALIAASPTLLVFEAATLQGNLEKLQQALGWTAEATRQVVLKHAVLLTSSPETVQAALAWLRQLFPGAAELADVVDRGPHLLSCPVRRLQGNAAYVRQQLGWQDGDGQLAAFVAARPADYATIRLSDTATEHKLRLLSEVVGVSREECLGSGIGYLNRRLESIAVRYMLTLERAPDMLFNRHGELHLSWIIDVSLARHRGRLGLSDAQYHAFVRGWPASEEGRRLLEQLRAGSVEGWPRPPAPSQAEQQQRAEAEPRRQARAARRRGTAAAMGNTRRGRGRRGKSQGDSGADGSSGGVEG